MRNFFNKILDEEYIQIKVGYQKAIERFQQLPTLCEQKLSLDGTAAFNCKKNGIFEIGYGRKSVFEKDPCVVGTCRIVGEIFLLNGKTVIKLRSYLKRFTMFLLLLSSFITICTAVFLLILLKKQTKIYHLFTFIV